MSAALINQCVFRDIKVVHSCYPRLIHAHPLAPFSTLPAKAPRALTYLTLHLICITVLVCSNSTPTAESESCHYPLQMALHIHASYPVPSPQPSHAVGVLRGSQGWMYLNQTATGSCSELQPKAGSSSAVCPWLQAASLLTRKALQAHRQPFVYQMSHGPQNHRTYRHTLLQAAQYPLTSVWGLLAASAD